MDDPLLHPIGRIRSELRSRTEAPRQGREGAPDAWLEVHDEYVSALGGIAPGDEIVVLTWLHQADRSVLEVHPRNDPARPLSGVFATRSPDRPNPIGLHRVAVRVVSGTRLRIGPIEAIDGTPVIDVKPVLGSADAGAPILYGRLADWWPLLSAPSDYGEEADFYRRTLEARVAGALDEVLELGSGGGNNASHLKSRFRMTLVDASEGMLAVSRALNPECEHVPGDMRSVRLGRTFDAVFVHDAIAYMTSRADLLATMRTARTHCRAGGATLFCPDHTRETFRPYTSHGGHDDPDGRGLRYLMWCWDPDPADATYFADFAYLLREPGVPVRAVHDRHELGLFPRREWIATLEEAGFADVERIPFEHAEVEDGLDVFLGRVR